MIKSDFLPYLDENNLLANYPAQGGTGTDNGTLFTSEYILILSKNGVLTEQDKLDYVSRIQACIDTELRRRPVTVDQSLNEIDDYTGVLAAKSVLGLKFNVPMPFRLHRFLQLVYLKSCADCKSWNPLYWPLAIVTAGVVLQGAFQPKEHLDNWILTWLLIQGTIKHSLLVKLVSNVFFKKLYQAYPNGMAGVADAYFQPINNNPYGKYWIT